MAVPPPFDAEKAYVFSKPEYVDDKPPLENVSSVSSGQIIESHSEDGQFHRSFSPHQVHIISLGSNIGSGLFIGTGAALAGGGPGNMVLAYSMVCSCVWAVLQTLTEMTIAFPVSGNYIDYADRWVDPALAFGAGLAEWIGWTAIVGSEAAFFNILLQFWANGSFPLAASLSIFVAACSAVFLLPNKVFAWFEYFTSLIKVFLFLIIIFLGLAIVLGAGPAGYVHHGEFWTNLPAFKNGFGGFAYAALLAVWAVGDQIFIGVMGGEAENPRFSMAHACNLVPYRVSFFYMTCVVFITLLIPSDDPSLLGGSGITASPFVLAINTVKIPVIANILNAGIICGIMAIAAESIYLSSRVLRTMAHQRLIPGILAKVDSKGRPRIALALTCGAGVLFTYINLSGTGKIALDWLVQITATSFFMNWVIVSFTCYRFRAAIKFQKDPLFEELYSWKMSRYPVPPAWLMTCCAVLLISSFYLAIKPLGGSVADFTVENFFRYTLGLWLIVGTSLLYKIALRTKWRTLEDADLKTGRRILTESDIAQLNAYYAMSKQRRFLSYLKMW